MRNKLALIILISTLLSSFVLVSHAIWMGLNLEFAKLAVGVVVAMCLASGGWIVSFTIKK